MKVILFLFFIILVQTAAGQVKQPLADVIKRVSNQWQLDANSCLGHREKICKDILAAQFSPLDKAFLLSKLGRPNYTQKFSSGNPRKNYVGYIYFVYKDNCPGIEVEGYAIQFVFDESESRLIEITEIEYCG